MTITRTTRRIAVAVALTLGLGFGSASSALGELNDDIPQGPGGLTTCVDLDDQGHPECDYPDDPPPEEPPGGRAVRRPGGSGGSRRRRLPSFTG